MTTNMKDIEFQSTSYEQWQEEAVKALKGKPFESLFTKTIDNITLEPLYTQETLIEKLGEQLEKQVSTIRNLTKESDFAVAQQIVGEDVESFFANLQESLARGNDVITINSPVAFEWNEEALGQLADYLSEYSFKLIVQSTNDNLLSAFTKIEKAKRATVEGYIIAPEAVELADYPNVRTFAANTIPFHNKGANAVQELAIALAQASQLANTVEDFKAFESKFFVNFAIDTQFFSEVAKIRAFKVLWKAFASAFGTEASAVPVVVETSVRSFSKLDVYVNLLRAGNEAFAAAIGGADVVTVHPHDCLTKATDQSVRIARNVSLVTKEESHVLNVLDPAGGSYFVESLTADLVKEAWALFLEIELAGGLDAYTALQSDIEAVYSKRIQAVETRKHSLIGTNIYANPVDTIATEENGQFADVKRLAIPFENLRTCFSQAGIKTAILTFGALKNYKPRADFVQGFFATAGIVAEQTEGFTSIEDAKKWITNAAFDYVVIAATDEDTKALVPALLDGKRSTIVLDAAGKYKEDEATWTATGLNGFIFAGQNIVEKLNSVVASVKGVQQ
ncbi:methylmalonyl-CoA mutase [Solibacillus sp. R5-41]|uniref:methylmalonyl-CoA mutase family protein n=1 Tax=Solibacillus sp. R5-41 TaxID=2048654 RepID=UPI000C1258CC|nr:methylmalonyl-CoA mutase family protein [Solibacillus sp. R5-41]ATP40920.1 methylmalonyl-CoA mutase [Solibacillus sp. R5-41]